MTSCCCRLTQMARMISINCHCCRTNFISVSVIRKTRADHWRPEKCITARTSVKEIGVCLRSGENDCGNTGDAGMHVRSAEMCGSDMLKSRLCTVFSARLTFLTSRRSDGSLQLRLADRQSSARHANRSIALQQSLG